MNKSFAQSVKDAHAASTMLREDTVNVDDARLQAMVQAVEPLKLLTNKWWFVALLKLSQGAAAVFAVVVAVLCSVMFSRLGGSGIGDAYPTAYFVISAILAAVGTGGAFLLALHLDDAKSTAHDVSWMAGKLADHSFLCKYALNYVQTVPEASALRDAVVGRGEELKLFHYYAMQRLSEARASEVAAEDARRTCQALHGVDAAPVVAV